VKRTISDSIQESRSGSGPLIWNRLARRPPGTGIARSAIQALAVERHPSAFWKA
jgi:hypothetical protein